MLNNIYKVLFICVLSILLGGCVKYVNVPVWVCPDVQIPIKQPLKSLTLNSETKNDIILKAMVWDIVYLNGYSEELLKLLEGYKKK